METQDITYRICEYYVKDHTYVLGNENRNRILGWIRSRSLRNLASCCDNMATFSHALAREKGVHQLDLPSERELYRCIRQISAFVKKNDSFVDDASCLETALASFNEAEQLCKATNIRLNRWYAKRALKRDDLGDQILIAERYICQVLGDFDKFMELIPKLGVITAGATSTRSRRKSLPSLKLSLKPVCTRRAAPYLHALYRYFGFGTVRPRIKESNRIEFVPKNWKTHRTIACENEGNMYLQLAFDEFVKGRLRKFGIDLADQSRNQRLAKEGSIDGSLATIDLSAASDTVSHETVRWLLPLKWFTYISDVRSSFGRVNSSTVKYEKFSSMGNGTTFALETLIFASLCKAVGSRRFSVYGDDIIIETELLPKLTKLLNFFGFRINTEKSFASGPFRESCGADCYKGVDITPFYLRKIDKRKAIWCHNINGLLGVSIPGGKLWNYCLTVITEQSLPLVPFNLSSISGVHIAPGDAYKWKLVSSKTNKGKETWIPKFRAYVRDSSFHVIDDSRSYYLWWLRKKLTIDDDIARAVISLPKRQQFVASPRSDFSTLVILPHVNCEINSTSKYAVPSHRYVRRKVRWIVPSARVPQHLFVLGDYLSGLMPPK